MNIKKIYTSEANAYWEGEYFVHGYKVVHDAGSMEKTQKLAEREIDLFLWPTIEKARNLKEDKENNPYPTFDLDYPKKHQPISKYFNSLNDKIALDYGCGILGRYTFALSKFFKKVYGIDIAKNAIEGCERLKKDIENKNCSFILNNGLDIKLPNEHIDFIFSNLVLQHVGYKEGIFHILKEFCRVLKPEGVMRLEFLDSSQKRAEGFFSVVEGCGMSIWEIEEEIKKHGCCVETWSECRDYLWITIKK